jgi:ankyrin repeat protein
LVIRNHYIFVQVAYFIFVKAKLQVLKVLISPNMDDTPTLPDVVIQEICKFIECSKDNLSSLLTTSHIVYDLVLTSSDLSNVDEHLMTQICSLGNRILFPRSPLGNVPSLTLALKNPSIRSCALFNGLIESSKNGHLEVVQLLLNDPRTEISSDEPISLAISNNHNEIARLLISNRKNFIPETHLLTAVKSNNGEIVKLLLQDSSEFQRGEIDQDDYDVADLVVTASKRGYLEILQDLFQDSRIDSSGYGTNALIAACKNQHVAVVEYLLQDPRIDPNDDYPIYDAIETGNIQLVKLFIDNPRALFPDRVTIHGNTELAKLLLEKMDTKAISNNIINSSRYGDTDIVELILLEPGIESQDLETAARYALEEGHLDIAKLLLKDKRLQNSDKGSILAKACETGYIEILELLIQDTDPGYEDNSAIRFASGAGHVKIVEMLLKDSRVDPSAENNSAIIWASGAGQTEVVKLLLADARVDPKADGGKAMEWAKNGNHKEVVALLE